MQYNDFELTIQKNDGDGYSVAAEARSELLREKGPLKLDFNDDLLHDALYRLESRNIDRQGLVDIGTKLYQAIFSDEIQSLFERSFGSIEKSPDLGLRLVLRIDPHELAKLPWELMYDSKRDFLATSKRLPIVRQLDVKYSVRPLETRLPVRILVIVAENVDPIRPLDWREELSNLNQAFHKMEGLVEPIFLKDRVTYDRLEEAMETSYSCFHFIGHGLFDKEEGYLLLHSNDGGVDYVDGQRFCRLFKDQEDVRLVVLNACQSGQTSRNTPFLGIAPQLVRLGIPAVVAMQHTIRDDAAIAFARRFYRALFQGQDRGRIEVAMSEARNRLASDFPEEREVATPVLFMRTRGDVLFHSSSRSSKSFFKLFLWREFRRTKGIVRDYEINSQADDGSIQEQEYARRNARQASDLSKRLKLARALTLTTSGVVAVVFLVSWVGLFNLPQLVGYSTLGRVTGMITMMLGDRVRPQNDTASATSLKTSIVQVRIEEPIDKSWRKRHGEIIEKLSEAGASVVGFDIYFEDDGQDDALFSESIRRARARNTAVVLGARSVAGGEPVVSAPLEQAATAIGILCLGTKWGYAAIAPVVVQKASQPKKLVPSLSLAMHMAERGDNGISLERAGRSVQIWGGDRQPYELRVSEVTKVNRRQVDDDSERACPAIEHGDIVADRYIAFSPLRPRHDSPSKILSSYERIEASAPEELKEIFEGRMVLIGVADPGKDQLTSHTDLVNVRYGMEVHVDAIRSLAQLDAIRSLSWQKQFLISLVLGSLAAAIVFGVPAERRLTRRALFWTVALGYFGCVIAIYLKQNILLDTVYQFGAFAIVYWAAVRIERHYAI